MSVQLRHLKKEDAQRLARYANNINIWNNVRDFFPHPYSLEDAFTFIEMANADTGNRIFAITINDELVGAIGLHPLKDIYKYTAELGYWIGEPFWGNGYASIAVNWITEYAWNHTEIIRIEAGVFQFNKASMAVLKKCGYIKEGTKRNHLCKNNKIYDEHTYVRLKV